MSSTESLSAAISQLEQHLSQQRLAADDLQSHRTGMQFALFAVVAAIKLTPDFNIDMLRQVATMAIDHPPAGFEDNAVFQEPLSLLLELVDSSEAA